MKTYHSDFYYFSVFVILFFALSLILLNSAIVSTEIAEKENIELNAGPDDLVAQTTL